MKNPQPHSATRARVRPVAQSHDFRLGFVPMIDGAPVIVAHEMGLFRKFGVRVRLGREAGWASIRDRLIHQEIVGAHAPASMAFALRCGLGSLAVPCLTAIVLAHNGSAITLSQTLKRAGAVDPLSLADVVRRSGASRRYRFAAGFEYATQHVNLRRWLAAGGVLGRQIKVIKEDGASDWPTFAEKAKKLLVKDKVASVFGCWTSASRKAVLPVFEKENGMLYYPTFYEGLEQSKNVIYTGQEATQQIIAGLDWIAKEKKAKTFYLIGSDYIWPRTSAKIARTTH